jgi:threonine/homoserine/homoserine lactone efflux protein
MLSVIGDILPLVAVVAANPINIIFMVLMLLSPDGKRISSSYLAGWTVGLVALMSIVILLGALLVGGDGDASRPTFVVLEVAIGIGLMYLAWRKWRARPAKGETVELPSWMGAVDSMSETRAFGTGLMLAAVNPKNIMLVASAGLMIAAADLRTSGVIVTSVVFVVLSTLSIGGPYVAYRVSPERVEQPLREVRDWLVENSATIIAALLFLIAVNIIGNAIGAM